MEEKNIKRKVAYGLTSFALGVWAFIKVNSISGPAFEPILAACTNPDIAPDLFAASTGYHEYDTRVGLKVFDVLVCLITQFLLELRTTHPSGALVWIGVVAVSLPVAMMSTVEAGRAGVRGPLRYPTAIGFLYQLVGISVIFPMIWLPAFVFGEGTRGAPVTPFRTTMGALLNIPALVLTIFVFTAPTDSRLWTTSAGMLGGPVLAMTGLVLFFDGSSELPASKAAGEASSDLIKRKIRVLMVPGLVIWCVLVGIFYQNYGTSFGDLWKDIWTDAGPSVAFMTVDTLVLYVGILLYVAYRHGEFKAFKVLGLTTFVGPAVAVNWILIEAEDEMDFSHLDADKTKTENEAKKDD